MHAEQVYMTCSRNRSPSKVIFASLCFAVSLDKADRCDPSCAVQLVGLFISRTLEPKLNFTAVSQKRTANENFQRAVFPTERAKKQRLVPRLTLRESLHKKSEIPSHDPFHPGPRTAVDCHIGILSFG